MNTVSCSKLNEKITSSESLVLLDVRHEWERDECHLENDVHIPLAQLDKRASELPKDTPIVVYCHHGIRSKQGAQILEQNGFTEVSHLEGGIHAWAEKIDPSMEKY